MSGGAACHLVPCGAVGSYWPSKKDSFSQGMGSDGNHCLALEMGEITKEIRTSLRGKRGRIMERLLHQPVL